MGGVISNALRKVSGVVKNLIFYIVIHDVPCMASRMSLVIFNAISNASVMSVAIPNELVMVSGIEGSSRHFCGASIVPYKKMFQFCNSQNRNEEKRKRVVAMSSSLIVVLLPSFVAVCRRSFLFR